MEAREIKSICSKAKTDLEIFHFKNLLDLNLNWDEYIRILNNRFNSSEKDGFVQVQRSDDRIVKNLNGNFTGIVVYNKMDPMISRATENVSDIRSVQNIEKFLKDLSIPDYITKCLSNLVGPENNYYIHKDDNDVFSFQALGKVEYRIYGTKFPLTEIPVNVTDLPYDSYILEPGDVVFIPKGVFHQVVVLEPRVTFISDFFYEL